MREDVKGRAGRYLVGGGDESAAGVSLGAVAAVVCG